MKAEQYNRATEIYERLKELENVKKIIANTSNHRLFYSYKCHDEFRIISEWEMRPIGTILDKHDKMIRKEIDEEIEQLKKEIETL